MARKRMTSLLLSALAMLAVGVAAAQAAKGKHNASHAKHAKFAWHDSGATTPIKHLAVVFQENVSFDHYFATYPYAANPPGEPSFTPKRNTPSVNGLNESLLAPNNPNSVQPFRLDRSQYETSDQDHNYTDEQNAFDHGLMDQFVEKVGRGNGPNGEPGGQVMGYYDGNTVTALWNYAQHFSMSDNSYSTTFGPSTPGALNLVSGQTHGFATTSSAVTPHQTVIGDPQPTGDKCDSRDNSTSTDPTTGTSAICSTPRE